MQMTPPYIRDSYSTKLSEGKDTLSLHVYLISDTFKDHYEDLLIKNDTEDYIPIENFIDPIIIGIFEVESRGETTITLIAR